MAEPQRGPALLRVIVSTADRERACAFYGDVLGLRLRRTHGDLAWLDLPDGQELLLHQRAVDRGDAAVAAGFLLDDVHGAVARWRSLGGVVLDEPTTQPWGEVMAVVRDPDGHIVCLSQRSPAHLRP